MKKKTFTSFPYSFQKDQLLNNNSSIFLSYLQKKRKSTIKDAKKQNKNLKVDSKAASSNSAQFGV